MSIASMTGSGITLAAALLLAGPADAAEGAASHYLPGAAGDFGLALAPAPGFTVANVVWAQSGDVGRAVLQGVVSVDLDLDLVLNLLVASYTFEDRIFGARYTIGAALPFGHARLGATVSGPGGRNLGAGGDDFALSDMSITPVQLSWSVGDFHLELAESVILPTGAYDVSKKLNLGRNYWSFDTNAALTWHDQDLGAEVSIQPGIMFNTKNNATDYRTGTELHVDFVANKFIAPTFALGPRGYWYRQITGDGGAGAGLGDFRSESIGLGGGFLWSPAAAGGRLSVIGKVMTDIRAKRRFDSTYGMLTLGLSF
ncbi:MAG: transporter [Pikeienuella sp.]